MLCSKQVCLSVNSCALRPRDGFFSSCVFFPGLPISQWLRGIMLDVTAARLIAFLQKRRYQAIWPGIVV
jgi:hypothetical protein